MKMSPIMICGNCGLPVPDSFHDFNEVCKCKDYKKLAKEKGWKLKFPDDKMGNEFITLFIKSINQLR